MITDPFVIQIKTYYLLWSALTSFYNNLVTDSLNTLYSKVKLNYIES